MIAVILIVVWLYAFFGTTFVKVPQEYQWLLALFSPFVRDICTKLMLEVAYGSAGKDSRGKYSVKFPVVQYVASKHAVFLAVIVGGVATPESSYIIMATDFAKTIYSGGKIIYMAKNSNGNDNQGNILYNLKLGIERWKFNDHKSQTFLLQKP